MPKIDSYLFFDGNCAEAMKFYEKTLGAKLAMMMKGSDAPEAAKVAPADRDKVMHARLELDDGRALMASDWMGGHAPYEGKHGFALSLQYKTTADAKRIHETLSQGGKVTMPMMETFWSQAFGMLVDRFGTPWMVSGPEKK
jgi:PhnB protein